VRKLCLILGLGLGLVGCHSSDDSKAAAASTPCSNGVRDANELGVDCGPACNNACDGATCTADTQCSSTKCNKGSCAASAGKKCGVGLANICNIGDTCGVDADCSTDYCSGKCAAPSADVHTDGRRDGGETGVDCGGAPPSPACAAGQGCKTNDDCVGLCGNDKTCAAPSPTDGKKDADETDIDCGGAAAPKCALDKVCLANADCELDACTSGKCVTPTSTDGVKNGSETDIDCGGAGVSGGGITYQAPRCTIDKACAAGTDCLAGACSPANKCEIASCATAETAGITSCGQLETGEAGAVHESCCTSLVLPTRTTRRMDKYEITAGRFRAFVTGAGPDLRTWTAKYAKDHPTSQLATLLASFPVLQNIYPANDLSDALSLTAHLSFDIDNYDGVRGCYNGDGSFGANTYYQDNKHEAEFGLPPRTLPRLTSDEKPMNCAMPIMFAAFCAWDGGELATGADYADIWPPANPFPFGPTNLCTKAGGQGKPGDYYPCDAYNWCNGPTDNGGFMCQDLTLVNFDEPGIFYEFPQNTDRSKDNEPLIAAPGRFPKDVTAIKSGNGQGWYDVFANLGEYTGDFAAQTATATNPTPNVELATFCDRSSDPQPGASTCTRKSPEDNTTATGTLYSNIPQIGIVGSTWEGHQYGPFSNNVLPATFQYGKFGGRCVRPAANY
jgi:hypothetical protein